MSNERTYNVQLTLYELSTLQGLLWSRGEAYARMNASPYGHGELVDKLTDAQDKAACESARPTAPVMPVLRGQEHLAPCDECGQVADE